jgi:hypothetical protein
MSPDVEDNVSCLDKLRESLEFLLVEFSGEYPVKRPAIPGMEDTFDSIDISQNDRQARCR